MLDLFSLKLKAVLFLSFFSGAIYFCRKDHSIAFIKFVSIVDTGVISKDIFLMLLVG